MELIRHLVPVMIVFTKFDLLVSRVQFDNTRGDTQRHEDPVAGAHAMYGKLCRSLFHREPKDGPAVIFSGNFSSVSVPQKSFNTPYLYLYRETRI
jgi:hypothetical protein